MGTSTYMSSKVQITFILEKSVPQMKTRDGKLCLRGWHSAGVICTISCQTWCMHFIEQVGSTGHGKHQEQRKDVLLVEVAAQFQPWSKEEDAEEGLTMVGKAKAGDKGVS